MFTHSRVINDNNNNKNNNNKNNNHHHLDSIRIDLNNTLNKQQSTHQSIQQQPIQQQSTQQQPIQQQPIQQQPIQQQPIQQQPIQQQPIQQQPIQQQPIQQQLVNHHQLQQQQPLQQHAQATLKNIIQKTKLKHHQIVHLHKPVYESIFINLPQEDTCDENNDTNYNNNINDHEDNSGNKGNGVKTSDSYKPTLLQKPLSKELQQTLTFIQRIICLDRHEDNTCSIGKPADTSTLEIPCLSSSVHQVLESSQMEVVEVVEFSNKNNNNNASLTARLSSIKNKDQDKGQEHHEDQNTEKMPILSLTIPQNNSIRFITQDSNLYFSGLDALIDQSLSASPTETMNQFLNALNMSDRFVFTTSSGSHLSTHSTIPLYDTKKLDQKNKSVKLSQSKFTDRLNFNSLKERKKAESFVLVLNQTGVLESKQEEKSLQPQANFALLDDPDLNPTKHKKVIQLQSFMGTIIQFSKQTDFAKDLDQEFRTMNPAVDTSLSLTMIRNMKKSMLEIGRSCMMELSSTALSFLYFEKLAMKGIVTKINRRIIGATCLLLSSKVNDSKDQKYSIIVEYSSKVLGIAKKEIFQQEFWTYVMLEFNLIYTMDEIQPHLKRVTEDMGMRLLTLTPLS